MVKKPFSNEVVELQRLHLLPDMIDASNIESMLMKISEIDIYQKDLPIVDGPYIMSTIVKGRSLNGYTNDLT